MRRGCAYDAVMAKGYKGRAFVGRTPPLNKLIDFEATELLVQENPDISDEQLRKDSVELRKAITRAHAERAIKIEVITPFSMGDIMLPEKEHDEHDILDVESIREMVRQITEDYVNIPIAGEGVGIPPQTAIEYLETGRADLAAGIHSRKAVYAKFVGMAANALKRELIKKIATAKMGFQNFSFILERCFPEDFSDKRVSKKETKVNSQLEALQRQLSGAMTPGEQRRNGTPPKPLPAPQEPPE